MQEFDSKTVLNKLLRKTVTEQEKEFLKQDFNVTGKQANKGILLMASLLDLAIKKGSVPAAKLILELCGTQKEEDNGLLLSMISELKE